MEINNDPRITFVIPFVGIWPRYIDLFLAGCRPIKNAQFFLFAEQPPATNLPKNVRHFPMSPREILERLKTSTDLQISTIPGHKLCDFRPFFGIAFADLLGECEFWGYCDIDMMFGNFDKIIDKSFLAEVDIFSAHTHQFVGHCTFLRNIKKINYLGFEIQNVKDLLSNQETKAIDEIRFSDVLKRHPEIRWIYPEPLDAELKKPVCRHAITFSFGGLLADISHPIDPVVEWRNGRLQMEWEMGKKTEILYVHFMGTKHPWHWPKSGFSSNEIHVFSKLGYGRIQSIAELKTWRARLLYLWQTSLFKAKVNMGKVLKMILPPNSVRALRRKIGI